MKAFWGGLILLAASAGEKPPVAGGCITGKVLWEGKIPEPRKIEVDGALAKGCACPAGGKLVKVDESLVVDPEGKGVASSVVWLKGVKGGPVLGPVEIDQKGCVYSPHVSVMTPGQAVKVLNPEGLVHTFQLWPKDNLEGNFSITRFMKRLEIPAAHFQHGEFIRVTCAPHSWMAGWIAVMESGYAAKTDGKGLFRIEGVPPGKYTLALWHEPIAPEGKPFLLEKEVLVEAGKEAEAAFTIGMKP